MPDQIFIVDDDADFCDSMTWLLESANLRVSAFNDAFAFLQAYDGASGCLLLDVRMPGMDGIALQQKLLDMESPLSVVVITGHASVPVAVNAMKQQAIDFLEKPFDDQQLLDVIKKSLAASRGKFEALTRKARVSHDWSSLTGREQQVMSLVVQGRSNRDIADQLGISVKTVEIHRSRVMAKMEAESLADLVVKSLNCEGLAAVAPPPNAENGIDIGI